VCVPEQRSAGLQPPRKLTDIGLIEAFNGRLRAECLNENWFMSIEDVRQKVEARCRHYNEAHTHSALGNLTPESSLRPKLGINQPDKVEKLILRLVLERGQAHGRWDSLRHWIRCRRGRSQAIS
jgi:hypothetical protein